jgi:hypothetical protein
VPTSTNLRDLDKTYAIEELQASVPVETVLLEIYNRAQSRRGLGDAFTYTLGVLEEACVDVDLAFDKSTATTTLKNGSSRSEPQRHQRERER